VNSNEQAAQKAKPVHEIKLVRIRASIWTNRGQRQDVWYSVSITRRYRNGETWKDTTSFGRDDLPLVVKAAEMAYAWIWSQQIEKRERDHVRS
jgi:hypothetical protein